MRLGHLEMLPERAFQPVLGRIVVYGKDYPSPPPPPDYSGAASATAAGNKEAAQQAQQANLVNQYTPYGNLIYTQDANSRFSSGNPSYSAQIQLSPTGQALLNYSDAAQLGIGSRINQGINALPNGPMDLRSVNDVTQKAYTDQTKLLDQTWQPAAEQQETKLRNQGLQAGDAAYDRAMNVFNTGKNNAYTQAAMNANNLAPQTYQLAQAAYTQPLNYLNALRTGAQVTTPQFGSTPQQQTVAGANLLGAAQAQGQYDMGLYNSQVAAANSGNAGLMSGLGSLGAAAITRFSDRRLKSDIVRVGTHPLGIGVYEYTIFGDRERGVMADEVRDVMPGAVSRHKSGYDMVDYSMIGDVHGRA